MNYQWVTNILINFKTIIQREENKNKKKQHSEENTKNNNNNIISTTTNTTILIIIEDIIDIKDTEKIIEEDIEGVNNSNIEKDLKEDIFIVVDINFF